jgi:hypothetical protein
MNEFIAKYGNQLSGTLAGFDRLVFRGTNGLNHTAGMKGYLWAHDLRLKDFGEHAQMISQKVKQTALAPVEAAGRPIQYLNSGKDNKQQIASAIAVRDDIRSGPICALTAVELCRSYAIRGEKGKLHLELSWRKCLFIYQYWIHPVFGFMSSRLQTWLPFPIHIYLNGREWLARQMERAGMRYRRHDNCFHLGGGFRSGTRADGRAAKGELGGTLPWDRPTDSSVVFRDGRKIPAELSLDLFGQRVGHGSGLPQCHATA